MIIPKEFRKGEIITSIAELRKIANELKQENLKEEDRLKVKIPDYIKVSLPIFNKRGYTDTWKFSTKSSKEVKK